MANSVTDIVIVGGGFSGTVTALRILEAAGNRSNATSLTISIIESSEEIGRGIAYSSSNKAHTVNGPAYSISLYPERPAHFSDWLADNAAVHGWAPPADADFTNAFAPRWLYGTYVQDSLKQALTQTAPGIRLLVIKGRAIDMQLTDAGFNVALADGSNISARKVVLALGLFDAKANDILSPGLQEKFGNRFIDSVWNRAMWTEVSKDQDILVLGSGLTALDAVLNAEAAGFRGIYHVLSRRGLRVHSRREAAPWPGLFNRESMPWTLIELMQVIRLARREIRTAGGDWQQLPQAIRPHVQALWLRASAVERCRFITRLRPFWEVTVHRAAPEAGKKLEQLISSGRFVQSAGHIRSLRFSADGKIAAEWTSRAGGESRVLMADRVVKAAGYDFDWTRIDDPLVRMLQERKLVRCHETGFGIDADPSTGALMSMAGKMHDNLFAVGHPLRGVAWESSAIPELLNGASNTARALLSIRG